MKMLFFSIRDDVAEVFNKPFSEINDATAQRAFIESLKENANRHDYSLYCIGEYNDHLGIISPLTTPRKILQGNAHNAFGDYAEESDPMMPGCEM